MPEDALFFRRHTSAVSRYKAMREKTAICKIFGRQQPALFLYGGHFSPELIEMDGGYNVETLLKSA